jgi:membrane protein required for colicin V production
MTWLTANWLDIILLLILAGFVFYGLFFGLLKTVGSLAGVVVGAWGAGQLYLKVFDWAKNLAFGHDDWGKVISFIICFTVINRLVGLLFALLDRTFNLISIIPFLKTINRLGGALLGFVEGGLVLGLMLYVIGRYPLAAGLINPFLAKSQLVPFLLQFTGVLKPLLPQLLQQLKSVI